MSAFDFQKLGSDRFAQNIKRAVTNPTGTLATGQLDKGTQVSVEFDAATSATATVAPRRTGALLLGASFSGNAEYKWFITGTTLTVEANGSLTGTFYFWVF